MKAILGAIVQSADERHEPGLVEDLGHGDHAEGAHEHVHVGREALRVHTAGVLLQEVVAAAAEAQRLRHEQREGEPPHV